MTFPFNELKLDIWLLIVYVEKLMDVIGLSELLRSVGGGVNSESTELQGDAMICLLYYKSF